MPSQALPSRPGQATPGLAKPGQAKTSKSKPSLARPSQAGPNQTKPNQASPGQDQGHGSPEVPEARSTGLLFPIVRLSLVRAWSPSRDHPRALHGRRCHSAWTQLGVRIFATSLMFERYLWLLLAIFASQCQLSPTRLVDHLGTQMPR